MQIYSPSSRQDFTFCNRYWYLRKNGLISRTVGYPELCAWGGNAVGKAMEVWNLNLINALDVDVSTLVATTHKTLLQSMTDAQVQGRTIGSSKDQEFFDSLPALAEQAVSLLYKTNPLKQYAIVAAEEAFPHAGGSRLDVRVKQPDGRGIVFDYKCKFGEMEERWLDKEFEKHFTGEQKYTYTTLTNTDMFGIILVVLKPRKDKRHIDPKVIVRTVNVTEREKQVWLRDAQLLTEPMNRTLLIQSPALVPSKTFPHRNEYGPCVYEDACIRYGLNPELMALDYITIKKES